jgi:hypothetical protein
MFNDLFYVYSAILGERRKGMETVANNFFNINKNTLSVYKENRAVFPFCRKIW